MASVFSDDPIVVTVTLDIIAKVAAFFFVFSQLRIVEQGYDSVARFYQSRDEKRGLARIHVRNNVICRFERNYYFDFAASGNDVPSAESSFVESLQRSVRKIFCVGEQRLNFLFTVLLVS